MSRMSPIKAQMLLRMQAKAKPHKAKPAPPPPPGSPPKAPKPPPAPKPSLSARERLETLPDDALKAKAERVLTRVDPNWDRVMLIKKLLAAGVAG